MRIFVAETNLTPETADKSSIFSPVNSFVSLLHLLQRKVAHGILSGLFSPESSLALRNGMGEEAHVGINVVVLHLERPVGWQRVGETLGIVDDDGRALHACLDGQQRQTLVLGRHEQIVERTEISRQAEERRMDAGIGRIAYPVDEHILESAVAEDVEEVAVVVAQSLHDVGQMADAFLLLHASGKEDVDFALHKLWIRLPLLAGRNAIIYNRWQGVVSLLVSIEHRGGDGDAGIHRLQPGFHLAARLLHAVPQRCVVNGAHHAAMAGETRKEMEEPIDRPFGNLAVAVDDCRTILQEEEDKPQRKQQRCRLLEEVVKRHCGNGRAVEGDVSRFHLADKLPCEGRTASHDLDNMILEVGILGQSNVECHALGSAHVEVGYDMEYSFHTTKISKMF